MILKILGMYAIHVTQVCGTDTIRVFSTLQPYKYGESREGDAECPRSNYICGNGFANHTRSASKLSKLPVASSTVMPVITSSQRTCQL